MVSDRQAVELAVMATTYRSRTAQIVTDLNRIFPELQFTVFYKSKSDNLCVAVMRDGVLIGESEGPFEVLRIGKP